MSESRVVIGIDDTALQEEVLHFLDRVPNLRVVAAAGDGDALATSIRHLRPDVAVAVPRLLRDATSVDGTRLLAIANNETTEGLRTAVDVGARGFYLWPKERDRLARDAVKAVRSEASPQRKGRVVAVYGPRGGAGVTFLATNLAVACAKRGARTVLVDCDFFYGDVGPAIGLEADEETRTVAELVPVLAEMTPEHLDQVLRDHPAGFRVLLAPNEAERAAALPPKRVAPVADVLRGDFDIVVLHLPRDMDRSRPFLEVIDMLLVVVTLDVLAFRDARRALSFLDSVEISVPRHLVINRAVRGDLVPKDAEGAFGLMPTAVIHEDRAVRRSQDRGVLVAGGGGRAARRIGALARRIVEGSLR